MHISPFQNSNVNFKGTIKVPVHEYEHYSVHGKVPASTSPKLFDTDKITEIGILRNNGLPYIVNYPNEQFEVRGPSFEQILLAYSAAKDSDLTVDLTLAKK